MFVDKLMPARVARVLSVSRVELDVDLGFGVHVTRTFSVEGIDPKAVRDDEATKAVHALVVLIGGKNVLIAPETRRSDARRASLYLNERLRGTPVGLVAEAPGLTRSVLDVAVFFNWIAERSFDVSLVREVVYGKKPHAAVEGD